MLKGDSCSTVKRSLPDNKNKVEHKHSTHATSFGTSLQLLGNRLQAELWGDRCTGDLLIEFQCISNGELPRFTLKIRSVF